MLHWKHQYSIEVDASLHVAWDFFTDPRHWPLYDGRIEAFVLDGDFKLGAQLKLKLKSNPNSTGILVTEVNHHREYRTLMHSLLIKEERLTSFEELTPRKTRVTIQICVLSIFVSFMKSKFLKSVEEAQVEFSRALSDYAKQFP